MKKSVFDFVSRYRQLGLAGQPYEVKDVLALEQDLGLPLPAAYQAYLLIAGASPPSALVGSDCHGDYLRNLREWAVELLQENDNPFVLPDDAVVFLMHQGYLFFYFRANGTSDDPAVCYYHEGRSLIEPKYEAFSDWVAAMLRGC